jgi:hypothetical protein
LRIKAIRKYQSGTHRRRKKLISAEWLFINEPPDF